MNCSTKMEINNKIKWETVIITPIENGRKFWRAITLSVIKPHLINRRLAGAEQICIFRSTDTSLNTDGKFINHIVNHIESQKDDEIDVDFLKRILRRIDVASEKFEIIPSLSKCDLNTEKQILVIFNKLLPKNVSSNACTFEINILGINKI